MDADQLVLKVDTAILSIEKMHQQIDKIDKNITLLIASCRGLNAELQVLRKVLEKAIEGGLFRYY